MRKTILKIFAFTIVNLALMLLHLTLFHSSVPFSAWLSMVVHFVLLVAFPYEKLITHKQVKKRGIKINKNNQTQN
jgi:hypothetical protein